MRKYYQENKEVKIFGKHPFLWVLPPILGFGIWDLGFRVWDLGLVDFEFVDFEFVDFEFMTADCCRIRSRPKIQNLKSKILRELLFIGDGEF